MKERVRACRECGNLTEEELCAICSDTRRDRSVICVVEQPVDVVSLERTHEYRGLYHVLGGALSPLDGVEPTNLRIAGLLERVASGGVERGRAGHQPDHDGRGDGRLPRRPAARARHGDAPRERPAGRRRPRVRRRGHARPRARRAPPAWPEQTGPRSLHSETWTAASPLVVTAFDGAALVLARADRVPLRAASLGRTTSRRPSSASSPPWAARPTTCSSSRGRVSDDARPARARHAGLDGRADRVRAVRDGAPRSRASERSRSPARRPGS